ncbi:MAG: M28 family peptidase [Planctomycetota bacterium]
MISRAAINRLLIFAGLASIGLFTGWTFLVRMPGESFTGPLPELTQAQIKTAGRLEADVRTLATDHAQRHTYSPDATRAAATFLADRLSETGLVVNITEHRFAGTPTPCINLDATAPGALKTSPIIVVGAHYDSFSGTPGADDNASGVAGVLELARRLARTPASIPVRFELFGNEEPPHFMTDRMGSVLSADAAQARGDDIIAMINLEMIGYFDDAPGSQRYPPPIGAFYPDRGDFIAIVGNVRSAKLVRRLVRTWRERVPFPVEGAALPESIPGIGFSDHRSFWAAGYSAVMVTDTSFYRNPHYHTASDTPETLDYPRMARVIDAVETVVRDIAKGLPDSD